MITMCVCIYIYIYIWKKIMDCNLIVCKEKLITINPSWRDLLRN